MWQVPVQNGIHATHCTTGVSEGVVMHMQGHEGLAVLISDSVIQLIVASVDKAAFLIVQDVGNVEPHPTPKTAM